MRALKQPLPSPPAGDHNYSLQGQRAAEPRPPPVPPQQPPAAGGCGPAARRRTVPSILRELAEKRQLSEEIVSLLQAQFSGTAGDACRGRVHSLGPVSCLCLTRAKEEARHSRVIAEPCASRQTSELSCFRGHAVALRSAVHLCHASQCLQPFMYFTKVDLL